MLSVSMVLPTYNERENVAILVPRLAATLAGRTHELVVVDDDSPDGTAGVVEELARSLPQVRLIRRVGRRGLGTALAEGYDAAACDVVVSMDADLSFDCADVLRLVARVEEGCDLVLGSRHAVGGRYEARALGVRVKRWISTAGNWVVRSVTGAGVRDCSANFRALRRSCWPGIRTRDNTNFMLLEMILRARRAGCAVAEVPVAFSERVHGVSKLRFSVEVPRFLGRLGLHLLRVALTARES